MITLNWESMDNYHERVKIFGGWLVKAREEVMHDRSEFGQGMIGGWDWRLTMCFVPDPNHEWK